MIRNPLKATTAIALALALASPHSNTALAAGPATLRLAQASEAGKPESPDRSEEADGRAAESEAAELCVDGTEPPCAPGAENEGKAEKARAGEEKGKGKAAQAEPQPGSQAGTAKGEPAADAAAEAVSEEAEAAVTEEPEEREPRAETDAETETAERGAEEQVPAAADAEGPAEAQAEKEVPSEARTATEAGAETRAESQAEAEPEIKPEAEEDETLPAEAAEAAEAPGQVEKLEEAGAAAAEEAPEAATAEPEQPPAEAPEGDGRPAEAKAEELVEPDAEASLVAQQPEERKEPAAAAAETGEAVEPVEVTSETVTEETTRSSDEEFNEAAAERGDDDGDNDDVDDLLKILGAAGAGLAAGALLSGGGQVVDTTGDRVIIERDGQYFVRKDENELLRRPGSEVRTETFYDGSTRTVVERDNGVRVVTIRDPQGYIVRRTRIMPDGREIVLFDDTYEGQGAVDVPPPLDYTVPHRRYVDYSAADRESLRETLQAPPVVDLERNYTLRQVREYAQLRELMPRLDLDNITFDLGSAAITPDQARELHVLGQTMSDILEEDPDEVFLIEGHTDAVGGRIMNLALSDRRAETVALALTEYYDIPPENLITQGYGEEYLKIETQGAERANRRVTVRRITPLLETARAR